MEDKLRQRLQSSLAQLTQRSSDAEDSQRELAAAENQYATALKNMTMEPDPTIKAEMQAIVVELQTRMNSRKAELQRHASESPILLSNSQRLAAALHAFDELPALAGNLATCRLLVNCFSE